MKSTYFIFDLDGTLADTLSDIVFSVNIMLKKLNMPVQDRETIKRSIGSGIHHVVRKLTHIQDENRIEQAVSLFRESYDQHFLDQTQLYDRAKEFITRPGFKGSVISNKPETAVKKILAGLDILPYFDMCIGGLGLFPHKPDPASVHHVISRFASQRNPFFIGDSIIDQQTSQNAGIRFCFARYGYEDYNETLINAECSINSFGDLFSLFP